MPRISVGGGTAVPSGPAGGDLAGSYPNPTVRYSRSFDVTAYGAVADNGATNNTAAFASCVAAMVAAGGGTILFPPNTSAYGGTMVINANVAATILGYGATLLAPDNGIGIDVATGGGGSILGVAIEGLHIKGGVSKTGTTGIRVGDSHRTRIRNVYLERLVTGLSLQCISGGVTTGTEGTTFKSSLVNNCTTGIEFVVQSAALAAGNTSFDETFIQDVGVNNCATGMNLGTSAGLLRCDLGPVTFWVPTNGIAVDCDADLTRLRGYWAWEAYPAATGCTGWKLRANAINGQLANIELAPQGSVSTKVDVTAATASRDFTWREGMTFYSQKNGGSARAVSLADGGSVRIGATAAQSASAQGVLEMLTVPAAVTNSPSNGVTIWVDANNMLISRSKAGTLRAISAEVEVKSANYTTVTGDRHVIMDSSGGARTVTLTTFKGGLVTVVQSAVTTNTITVQPSSGTINGSATNVIAASQFSKATYLCDGTNWFVVG